MRSLLVVLLAGWLTPLAAMAGEVRVATASNFRPTLDAVATSFEEATGHDLVIASGSTGKLFAQTVNGAPFDIFLSADQRTVDALIERDIGVPETRFTYALGVLVLWHADDEPLPLTWLTQQPQTVAIAHPDLAPYGAAAHSVLARSPEPRHRVVRGENVSQAMTFARTGHVDGALVAKSLVVLLPEGAPGSWTPIPRDWYAPLDQDAVLLKRAHSNTAARAFLEFLATDETKRQLRSMGYEVP